MIAFKLGEEFHAENMMNFSALLNAQSYVEGGGDDPVISADIMRKWNKLIDFAKQKGYAGKPELDHNPALRQKVFDEYNKLNPDDAIPISIVKSIQAEIKKYRQKVLDDVKAGKGVFPTGVTPDNFMKNISQEDNIFGQKTSQWAFPVGYYQGKEMGFAPKVDTQIQNLMKK